MVRRHTHYFKKNGNKINGGIDDQGGEPGGTLDEKQHLHRVARSVFCNGDQARGFKIVITKNSQQNNAKRNTPEEIKNRRDGGL